MARGLAQGRRPQGPSEGFPLRMPQGEGREDGAQGRTTEYLGASQRAW